MFILAIDPDGISLAWCLRCVNAGHTVKMYTKGSKASHIGDGLIDKVDNWKKYMGLADLVFVADNLEFMDDIEPFKKKGYPVFGPGKKNANLELDRMYGQEVIEKFGGETIPSHKFTNYDQAITFVKQNPKRWVSKPIGEEEDKSLSYVAKDEADMIGFLMKRKEKGKKAAPFILQEFRPGVEFCVTGMFGPGGWSKYWFEGFEHKKLMDGELGVNTGEMGTVIRCTTESKLADMLMRPMEKHLHEIGYTGCLDMNVIVDEKTGVPYPMEWTARPGWPAWTIIQTLIDGDPAQWMKDLLDGKDTLKGIETVSSGVVIMNSDFPFNSKDEESYLDFPITTGDADIDHVHPCEVKLTKTVQMIDDVLVEDIPEWGTAGNYLLIVTGLGDTVSEASKNAYKNVDEIKVGNDMGYRKDIGEKCEDFLAKLHKLGYAKNFKY